MTLQLMSFNIRFDNPHDGPHAWPHRRHFLAQIINDFETDILGTQEGRRPQLEELATLLPNLEMAIKHREWIEERMYPTLFYNPHKFKLIASDDIWLSETPNVAGSFSFESAFPRLCTWAHLEAAKGMQFICADVHLDHVKESTRLAQAKVLANELLKVSEELPIILMGDFNSAPNTLVRNQLLRDLRDLGDPWEILGREEKASYHNFGPIPADASRIDWFLLSKSIEPQHIELGLENKNGLWPSDHYPLKLKIALNNH